MPAKYPNLCRNKIDTKIVEIDDKFVEIDDKFVAARLQTGSNTVFPAAYGVKRRKNSSGTRVGMDFASKWTYEGTCSLISGLNNCCYAGTSDFSHSSRAF